MTERMTKRNYHGKAYVPGYAPRCIDKETCELLWKVVSRLAVFEDLLEYPGIFDSMPQEAIQILHKGGILE